MQYVVAPTVSMATLTNDLAGKRVKFYVYIKRLADFNVEYICTHTGVQAHSASISMFGGEFTKGCLS